MRFKLDENLSPDIAALLNQCGHNAMTVAEQSMTSSPDDNLIDACHTESRALMTTDLDFCDIRVFPPADYSGIIVFRPFVLNIPVLERMVRRILPMFDNTPVDGHLWIVDDAKVRIRS